MSDLGGCGDYNCDMDTGSTDCSTDMWLQPCPLDNRQQAESLADGDSFMSDKDPTSEEQVMEKDEPIYHLDRIKNDFFEKGAVLTLQVYCKQVNKDTFKIDFNKDGFVLKFQTDDSRFLQLHEGSTADTIFIWEVTTRQEILPEQCKFKVKTNLIEIQLQKTRAERWTSLEAPTRKESAGSVETFKGDDWVPINSSSQSSAPSVNPAVSLPNIVSSSLKFDDISGIDVRGCPPSLDAASTPSGSDQARGCEAYGIKSSSSPDYTKPTAKVHPLNSQQISESGSVVSPGFVGLANLGNTCFMNCVLQVLANTREFRDYFLDDLYVQEINEENPLGMKGQLAATFGNLLRCLWSCKKSCYEPRRLKELIARKNAQFFGYAQHDAHEFLAFLLDGLHEDLNRVKKKPYTQNIDSDGRPDEVVAAQAWAQYKQRNDSVVVDLFQGQYKSKLVCPVCGKVSITFDPFLYLSVPLPKKKIILTVTFMWKESYRKPVRYHIQVPQDSIALKVLEELSFRTKVLPQNIRMFEAYKGCIKKIIQPGTKLEMFEQKDTIIACEVLSEQLAGEKVLEIIVMQRAIHPIDYPTKCAYCLKPCPDGTLLKRCTKCLKVGYCDHTCQRNHWSAVHKAQCRPAPEPVGCPFIVSLPYSRATYRNLVQHLEDFSRFSVNVFQPPVKHTDMLPPSSSEPGPRSLTSLTSGTLTSSLSQSCSSLNSLDSLSSASSTCTLTGNQSDPLDMGEDLGDGCLADNSDCENNMCASASAHSGQCFPDKTAPAGLAGSDSGFESCETKSSEKSPPVSQVLGVSPLDGDREKAMPTFYIKPVTLDGLGIMAAARLEDKGDEPLDLGNQRVLSMDWRNNDKQPSYVLVQSKDLDADEFDDINNMAASLGNKATLDQCLELFTEPEVLSQEEAWFCPSCREHVQATKQMTIWRLPHILIIQLKRFSFQNLLFRAKVKKPVQFPTRGLDLRSFCVGLQPGEQPPVYDLYGVVNHHGLLVGGHYTSYVRCCGPGNSDEVGWRLCDDSRVTSVANEKSVVTADAYLLFYHRRSSQPQIWSFCGSPCTDLNKPNKKNSVSDGSYCSLNHDRETICQTAAPRGQVPMKSQLWTGVQDDLVNENLINDSLRCNSQARSVECQQKQSAWCRSFPFMGCLGPEPRDQEEKTDAEKDSEELEYHLTFVGQESGGVNNLGDNNEDVDNRVNQNQVYMNSDLNYTDMEAVD